MSKAKAWLQAARLRTLPLSVSGILVGTALAASHGFTDPVIFVLAILTTIGFQVTSNFANDYGDGVKGTDNTDRIGPARALQSGLLSRRELKNGILASIALNAILVVLLLTRAFGFDYPSYLLLFVLLGFLSIWAAVKYTVGRNAYGYRGLGDLFVFVFFGLLSVMGSLFLYGKTLFAAAWLPATAIGLLSTAVLNLNNMRDLNSDQKAGKKTLAVILGPRGSKAYHAVLILGSALSWLYFSTLCARNIWQWLPVIAFVPLALHLFKIFRLEGPDELDPELKKIALSTFLLSLLCYFTYYFL